MGATVIPITELKRSRRTGQWCLLEVAAPGQPVLPWGILLADDHDQLIQRCRTASDADELLGEVAEQEYDLLDFLAEDLRLKAAENGAAALLNSLEGSLSGYLRISDRTELSYTGSSERAVESLFDEHVDKEVRQWVTHLPLYGLRAAATKFGEGMAIESEGWVRVAGNQRLTTDMFVATVVGRSMEPRIPDNSLCIFRANVTGTRQGRLLLIEKFGESDFASRYTVKRYSSRTQPSEDGEWEHKSIRLEPLNREFEAFELGEDGFRVIAEFVEVLGTA